MIINAEKTPPFVRKEIEVRLKSIETESFLFFNLKVKFNTPSILKEIILVIKTNQSLFSIHFD